MTLYSQPSHWHNEPVIRLRQTKLYEFVFNPD